MPELPEVEVTRASLAPRLLGAEIRQVRVGKPLTMFRGVLTGVPEYRGDESPLFGGSDDGGRA